MKNFYSNAQLNEIVREVLKYLPSFEPFYESTESLTEYSRRISSYRAHSTHLNRQTRFKERIRKKIQSLFNTDELHGINLDFMNDEWSIVGGIVEHHGILDHPLLLSVSLVSNFYKLLNRNQSGDILSFATGNISLNEPFRRRGLVMNERKINLFPRSDKEKVVYGLNKYDFDIINRLKVSHQWHSLTRDEQKIFIKINGLIHNIDFSSCNSIGDQLTKINFHLWPLLFHENLRNRLANLISLEYEDIVIDYLIFVLEHEQGSFVYQMLFDDGLRNEIFKEFAGVPGAWDEAKGVGTYFFWALDEHNKRIRLGFKDGCLVGNNESFKLKFELPLLINEMREKRMLPGMLLKFALIMFYMGMKPLAGFSLEYLTRMRTRMARILQNNFPQEAGMIELIPLDNMNLISICKGINSRGRLHDLHAFDIMYHGGFREDYFEKLDRIPFRDFMASSLLFAYDYGIDKYGTNQDKENKKRFAVTEETLQKPLLGLVEQK